MNADRDRSEAPARDDEPCSPECSPHLYQFCSPECEQRYERKQRYAWAIYDDQIVSFDPDEVDEVTEAVMAVADEEQENLRTTVEMDLIYQRKLEAKLARVEALHNKWATARNISDGRPNPVLIGISAMLRAALTDPS